MRFLHKITCRERKREAPPRCEAKTWSIDGPPAPRPEKGVPVINSWNGDGRSQALAYAGGRIIEAADDVDIVAKGAEGREAGCKVEILAGSGGNPIALGDTVAVEPEDEPGCWGSGPDKGAAYAVPCGLNIASRGGRPSLTNDPESVSPFRRRRLVSGFDLGITDPLDRQTASYRYHKLPEAEAGNPPNC